MRHGLDDFSIASDIHQYRRAWNVVVPDAMVHELEVPLPFARLQIDGDEGLRKQIVTRAIRAKVITGCALDRQIRNLQLRLDADLSPRAGIARVRQIGSAHVWPP